MEESLVGKEPHCIAPFLSELFRMLDSNDIVWAVMRGWEGLPLWTRYDVDILVARESLEKTNRIVLTCANCSGWYVYGVWRPGKLRSIWMAKVVRGDWHYLRIDIEIGNIYRGIEIHESLQYLQQRVYETRGAGGSFWRMADGYAAASVLMKQLAVSGGVDTERRREQVFNGVKDPIFTEIIRTALRDKKDVNGSLTCELLSAIKEKDWPHVNSLSRKVKRRVFRFTPGNMLRMLGHCFRVLWIQIHPFMRLVVVFVGPDGSGKTTIADKVEERFKGRPFQGTFRIHMHFGVPRIRSIINAIGGLFGRKTKGQELPTPGERHVGMGTPHSAIRAMLYVMYYGLGMILGRLRLFFWRTQGGLVIADRFFQDYYYMRGFVNCPTWFIRMIERVTPHPDFIFSLERPAHDIYEQKPELTEEEIERQQMRIRTVLGARANFRSVDASRGIDETVSSVTKEIEQWIISHSV